MPDPLVKALAGLVPPRVTEPVAAWFEEALGGLGPPLDRARFFAAFGGAGRRLGRAALTPTPAEEDALRSGGLRGLSPCLGVDECGRMALLLTAMEAVPASEAVAFVDEAFRKGEVRERQAVLRALAYLPQPERFVEIGMEACRTSVQTVFEAIACENPFPASHFPELHFNHLVLKAFFTETATERIFGLADRLTPELARMLEGYESERRAAGRPVPAGLPALAAEARRRS